MKSKIDITGVSETMLQTLYARAKKRIVKMQNQG